MTVKGIGVDLCEIARMEKFEPDSRFVERFFSDAERAYLAERRGSFARTLAGMFAAKEAFSKALGTGIRGFELKEVEILHTPEGKPYYRISGKALKVQKKRRISELFLSISYEKGLAAAFAVAQGPDNA